MGASGPLLHINENSEWENLNHFFCRNVSLLTGHRCQFRGVSQDMSSARRIVPVLVRGRLYTVAFKGKTK
jgi:hypothetical protein